MVKRMAVGALALVSFLSVTPDGAQAQIGIAGEGRLGVTFPLGDLSDAGTEAGLGYGAELQLNFQRNLTAYVGLARYTFSCQDDCSFDGNPNSTGLGTGLKFILPSPSDALLWGRAGVVANKLDKDPSGDRNIGFELGAGIDMPVAERLYLVPHLGFISHGSDSFTANFVTFGVGVHYHLR